MDRLGNIIGSLYPTQVIIVEPGNGCPVASCRRSMVVTNVNVKNTTVLAVSFNALATSGSKLPVIPQDFVCLTQMDTVTPTDISVELDSLALRNEAGELIEDMFARAA